MPQAPRAVRVVGRSVSIGARALFARHLAVMLKSGVTLTEALSTTRDAARGSLKAALEHVLQAVETGRSLSSAFADYPHIFPPLFVQATYAGEVSGTLSENQENIARELEKEKELVTKIRGALLYPAVVLVAAFLLALGLSFFVLPKIVPLFQGLRTELPLTTRALIRFSNFISAHGVSTAVGIILGACILVWLAKRPATRPFTHLIILRAPITGTMARNANMTRFSRTLGMLLRSGVSIDEALTITQKSLGNYYYQQALVAASMRIVKGARLSESLADYPHLFPMIATKMIRVGEEAGRFEETLLYLASFYEAEVDASTRTLSVVLEPLLLLLIGLVVGGLALAIITPIYEITGNIRY